MSALLAAASLAFALHADSAQATSFGRAAKFVPRFGEATFDVLILRPLSGAALLAGSVFFVASVPFVAPFEGLRPAWNTYVYAPYEYTVLRDIGDF
jgi:hypothetical protein